MKLKKPIVTHISTVHPISDVRIFHKECKSLVKSGFQVNLIITHDKKEVIEEVTIIPLKQYDNRFKRMLIKPFKAFSEALKTRSDLYHFHDPELIPIGLLLKFFGKKVIYDVHEDVPSQIMDKHWISFYLRSLVSSVVKGIENISSRLFDGIVCATPYITDIFLKRNVNTINVNNYPLLEELADIQALSLQKRQDKVVCYLGSISKTRGICELVKALEGTDITLNLAGKICPTSLLEELEREKGWDNVVYFGHIGREKINQILGSSAAGICILHPTRSYIKSLPIKVFEYISAGLPLVVSNFAYWQELLVDFRDIYFIDPLDPVAIRKALIQVTQKGCVDRNKDGIKAIQNLYNWTIEEEKLFQLYRKLGVHPPTTYPFSG